MGEGILTKTVQKYQELKVWIPAMSAMWNKIEHENVA